MLLRMRARVLPLAGASSLPMAGASSLPPAGASSLRLAGVSAPTLARALSRAEAVHREVDCRLNQPATTACTDRAEPARTNPGPRRALIVAIAMGMLATVSGAQAPPVAPTGQTRRIEDRIRALREENVRLAQQAQTLLVELRALEVQRDLRTAEAAQAESAALEAQRTLDATTVRLAALEEERTAQLPDLKVQLVDIYKRGRSGYARMLFGAGGVREFGRATRSVAALSAINTKRVEEHRRTLEALAAERARLEKTAAELQARQAAARQARSAAERAVTARAALITRIDSERDLMARYVGELQVAYERLQQELLSGSARAGVAVPLAPFRGALEWPAPGRLTGRFGQTSGRLGGTAVRNGIEIAAGEGTPVRAVHGGTVGYAGPWTGFGTLVIVDHGSDSYSLYGYLGSATVQQGNAVEAGAEVGRVGLAPAGPPALYFELRIDGRSVDPVQWLKRQ
jgi:septal ring factor EnvC (AmiA/AmiB activator)